MTLKKIAIIAVILLCMINVSAQNTVVTDDENYVTDTTAVLDIYSNSKGVLIPRLTTSERLGISNPAKGLLVFDNEFNSFFYHTGDNWRNLSAQDDTLWTHNSYGVHLYNPNNKVGVGSTQPVGKLEVKGDDAADINAPLFNVVNSNNDTVFAVYPGGVRINIPDTIIGKVGGNQRGGFAVGGFSPVKAGEVQDFLVVSKDSVRVYIEDNESKVGGNQRGGFAVGGFSPVKSNQDMNYFDIQTTSSVYEMDTAQARILWYPNKEAFLTGKVIVESEDSIGLNSFATGFKSKPIGDYSQAMGYNSISRGDYSIAIGDSATASGDNSYAFGYGATASGDGCYAFGSYSVDTLGVLQRSEKTYAGGAHSIAIGMGAKTNDGFGNVSIGALSEASGERYSVAIGNKANAEGNECISIGNIAYYTLGGYPMPVFGYNTAKGFRTMSLGFGNVTDSKYSIAMGTANRTYAPYSMAMGFHSFTNADKSIGIGNNANTYSFSSVVVGSFNEEIGDSASWVETDPVFVVGNGRKIFTNTVRSDAFRVYKNGNAYVQADLSVGIAEASADLHIVGNDTMTTALIAPGITSSGGNSRLMFAEDDDGSFGVYWQYDGINNNLELYGKSNIFNYGPHITVARNTGNTIFSGKVTIGEVDDQTEPLAIADLAGTSNGSYLKVYNDNIYYSSSSRKTKRNIKDLKADFKKILNARPVSFIDKATGEKSIGFIAEEFDEIGLKNLVIYENGSPKSLSYELVSLYNLQIIKQHEEKIKALEQENAALKKKIENKENIETTAITNQLNSLMKEIEILKQQLNLKTSK